MKAETLENSRLSGF